MSDTRRRILVVFAALALLAVAIVPAWRVAQRLRVLDARTSEGADSGGARLGQGSIGGALALATTWVNGPAPTRAALASRPVAVLIWSDTDPASADALDQAEAWRAAYGRYGVIVVGVHAPDFAFAADSAVPARAALRAGAAFPIACDPTGEMRRRLDGESGLPIVLVADTSGTVVWRASGPDRIAGADAVLRDQVARLHPEKRFPSGSARAILPGAGAGPVPRVVYLGSARVLEGPLVGATIGQAQPFTAQFRFQVEGRPYVPYPVGWWTPAADGLSASRGGADQFVALRYDGGAVYAVTSPPEGARARLWVLRDEAWLLPAALGADARLDEHGASYVEVSEPRLYAVTRGPGQHVLKLSPSERGLTLHALVIVPDPSGPAGP